MVLYRGASEAQEPTTDPPVRRGDSQPSRGLFAMIYGVGHVLHDSSQGRRRWPLEQRAYYATTPADLRLAVLRVHIESAALEGGLAATAEGSLGENCKLDL